MDRALQILLKLQGKALVRRLTRGAKSIKGALFLVIGVTVFALWLLPSVWAARITHRSDPADVRAVTPVALLAACVLTVLSSGGEKAIVFTPAEVDFLFPGPFTRRQILLYRIVKSSTGAILSALILSVVFLRHASSWPAALLTMVLGMLFLQYLGIAILLGAQTLGERTYSWGRRLVVFTILAAIAVPLIPFFMRGMSGGIVEMARLVRASPVGRVFLIPVEPFGLLLTAPRIFPDLLGWAAVAAAINVALLWLIFWLDADYLESAAARSAILQEKIARARKLGIGAPAPGAKVRFSPPMLPFWHGAGPVTWRQLTSMVRGSKGLLFVMILVVVVSGPALYGARKTDSEKIISTLVGALAWITIVVAGMVKFDFRGDVDHMEVLKALPLPRWSLCVGQIAVPVFILTTFHWLVLAGVLIATRHVGTVAAIAAAVSLPFNALVFLVENIAFLMYPVRGPQGAMDFQNFGRQTLFFFAKMFIVMIAGGIAAVGGLFAWHFTHSMISATTVALLILLGAVVAMMPLLMWAFTRYDVSLDTPA